MKSILIAISLICISIMAQPYDLWSEQKTAEEVLRGADAYQAMKIANEWKWTRPEIKSSVYSNAIVFKLPNGRIKQISLPENQMVVAVAPYINNTHK